MSFSKITIKNVDNNLFSGSRDVLRTEFGLDHYVGTDEDGHSKIVKRSTTDESDWLHEIAPDLGLPAGNPVTPSKYLMAMATRYTGTDPVTTSSANVAFKTKKYRCRLIGDPEYVESDLDWKTRLLGGVYNDKTYKNIFSVGTYDDHSYEYERPLNITKAKELAAKIESIGSYVSFQNYEIGYNYNYYLSGYQNTIKNVNNLMIPNVYMLQMVANAPYDHAYPEYMKNFVSAEGSYELDALESLFADASTEEPPPHSNPEVDLYSTPGVPRYFDQTKRFRDYLSKNYASASFTNNTADSITATTPRLYYDSDFADEWFKTVNENIHRMPVSAFVRFPTHGVYESSPGVADHYTDIIKNNKIEEDVLHYLANNFGSTNQQLNFVKETLELQDAGIYTAEDFGGATTHSLVGKEYYKYQTKITDNKKVSVDFLSALGSVYEMTKLQKTSGYFMGPWNLDSVTSQNPESRFSFYKRMHCAQAIEDTIGKMNDIMRTTDGMYDVRRILETLENNKGPAETIAYRLKKVGGSFLDSERKVTTLQNVYFMNANGLRSEGADMVYHDTQVKMGEQYSYTLYAYVVIPGYQYKYDNLRISRQIGTVTVRDTTGSFHPTTDDLNICLEFYDPATDAAADQLMEDESNLLGSDQIVIEGDDQLDVFRYSYLYKDDLAIEDCILGLDPAIKYDTYAETSAGGTDYSSLMAGLGPIGHSDDMHLADAAAALSTYSPDPGMKLKDFFESYRGPDGLFDPAAVYSGEYVFGFEKEVSRNAFRDDLTTLGRNIELLLYRAWAAKTRIYEYDGYGGDREVELSEPAANRFATNAQIKSNHKYLADYNFTIAPSVKIIEIPVATKTIQIMDHPPVAPDVTPYQRKDDSQIIGFYVRTESFRVPTDPTDTTTMSSFGIYPTALNNGELTKANIYKTSNNMIEGEQIAKNSVSKPSMLEVYRIDKKPTSIADFDGNLVFTKDLSIDNMPNQMHTTCFYEEKIRTNKKYYYLFRFLNQNGDGGYLSPIQCAELINDGGYKYTKFDVIYESELGENDNRQTTTQFKKLLQISPSIDHLKLNDANVDYSQPAITQISNLEGMVGTADDLIWGKTFKFRITSKKTGKKLDLNIKYNLRDS